MCCRILADRYFLRGGLLLWCGANFLQNQICVWRKPVLYILFERISTTVIRYIQIGLNEAYLFVGADNVSWTFSVRILADSFT